EWGRATVFVTVSTAAGTDHVVRATDGEDESISGEVAITTTAGPAAGYEVKVSDLAPRVGSQVTVVAQLVDRYGNAVAEAGREVEWSVTNEGQLREPSTRTNEAGAAEVIVTVSTVAGTEHVVTATDAADSGIRGESEVIVAQTG